MPEEQRRGVSLNLEGMTLEQIERKLAKAIDDPVQSRLLEAARVELIMEHEGKVSPSNRLSAGHIDIQAW